MFYVESRRPSIYSKRSSIEMKDVAKATKEAYKEGASRNNQMPSKPTITAIPPTVPTSQASIINRTNV